MRLTLPMNADDLAGKVYARPPIRVPPHVPSCLDRGVPADVQVVYLTLPDSKIELSLQGYLKP